MILQKASYEAIKYACKAFHYSKSVPANPVGYSVFSGGEVKNEAFCGVIIFAVGANRSIASPYSLRQGQVIELVRVALNGKQESTSKAVSVALRLIKKDVPLAKLIVSYADLDRDHVGTLYQATNWFYEGLFQAGNVSGYVVRGKKIHKRTMQHEFAKKKLNQGLAEIKMFIDPKAVEVRTKGKHKYLYPLTPAMLQLCKARAKPYPKKQPAK
jgi:hypothetical protein